jgi:hypothetical protein
MTEEQIILNVLDEGIRNDDDIFEFNQDEAIILAKAMEEYIAATNEKNIG